MRCYDTPPLPPSQGFLGMMDPSELGICTVRAGGGHSPWTRQDDSPLAARALAGSQMPVAGWGAPGVSSRGWVGVGPGALQCFFSGCTSCHLWPVTLHPCQRVSQARGAPDRKQPPASLSCPLTSPIPDISQEEPREASVALRAWEVGFSWSGEVGARETVPSPPGASRWF